MTGMDYYIPAALMTMAMLVKLPGLWRDRGSPTTPAFLVILATSAAGFALAAPPTVQAVNRATGVPNISALIVYCILSIFSCASLVLLMHWRGGPPGVVRRHTRMWMAATAGTMVVFCVLFAFSDTPVERARDLDTYYANTPYIREMIVLYLSAHTATTLTVITMCRGWLRELAAGWTRYVLLALMAGYAMSLTFSILKGIAVSARWAGTDRWDWLSTDAAPPFTGLGALITTVACLLSEYGPPIGARWRAWRSYRRMEPLWRALEPWGSTGAPMRMPWFTGIEVLEMQRATDIRDRLLRLSPHLNTAQLKAAQRLVAAEGPARETALIEAEAAEIHSALAKAPVTTGWSVQSLQDTATPQPSGAVALAGANRLAELSQAFSALCKTRPSTAASESLRGIR
ncbi:MAB_1171c family putative transporter [Streptomyces sp. NPDC048337]|uniref:MAB_1171c family putative transporter n=1 Tax=Streptomyces sp. NPDC048337 TaxID=3365535 RepID=UPI003723EDAF